MAKVSKSILFGYLKCSDLATKWTNILDSFRHKDEKIAKEDLADDAMVETVDNLTSSDTDKALSANQGKVLDAKITALPKHEVGDNSDLDDGILNGKYPIETHPMGSTHTDTNSENVGLYRRVSATEWMFFQNQAAMQAYFDTKYATKTDLLDYTKTEDIQLFPAPYLDDVIPDSYLPDTTGNFILKGAYFTEQMCFSENINSTNGILLEGQLINYATFISDNEIHCNVTTGVAEGSFGITLSSGGNSLSYSNVLLIVLGDTFSPSTEDWALVQPITVNGDTANIVNYDSEGSATWNQTIDYSVDWRINFQIQESPLGSILSSYTYLSLISSIDGSEIFKIQAYKEGGRNRAGLLATGAFGTIGYIGVIDKPTNEECTETFVNSLYSIRWLSGVLYLYRNSILISTIVDQPFTENMNIKVLLKRADITNIKYIELATS
jgi:hypothetical protein